MPRGDGLAGSIRADFRRFTLCAHVGGVLIFLLCVNKAWCMLAYLCIQTEHLTLCVAVVRWSYCYSWGHIVFVHLQR